MIVSRNQNSPVRVTNLRPASRPATTAAREQHPAEHRRSRQQREHNIHTTGVVPRHRRSKPLSGAMPAVPRFLRDVASSAADTRIVESRQLRETTAQVAQSLAAAPHTLTRRLSRLLPRQSTGANLVAIPYFYQYGGPSPGAVAGIVLGSVFGFLLLMWLFWSLSNGSGFIRSSDYEEEDVVVRRRSRSRRGSRRREMTSRSPRRERVIRQERIVRDIPPREPSRVRETVIVDEGPRVERRVS